MLECSFCGVFIGVEELVIGFFEVGNIGVDLDEGKVVCVVFWRFWNLVLGVFLDVLIFFFVFLCKFFDVVGIVFVGRVVFGLEEEIVVEGWFCVFC